MDWIERHIQNLATTSGFGESEARKLFIRRLHVSIDPALRANRTYELAFAYAVNLLSRIFPSLTFDELPGLDLPILPWVGKKPLVAASGDPELILHFGRHERSHGVITANCHNWHVRIDMDAPADPKEAWNPILGLLTACYAAARVCKVLLGEALTGQGIYEPFSILDFQTGEAPFDWTRRVNMGKTTLAGVGAIGSGFLYALAAHGMASGHLTLVDHDILDRPNLCRYSFFSDSDVDLAKVLTAKRRIDAMGMRVQVDAIQMRFERYFDESYNRDQSFRIERLISAPDRRDTRRRFQEKLPKELWDASTGPNQAVLHHNCYDPRHACLACIYRETPDENAHLRHIADVLNLSFERVLSGESISEEDANAIHKKYPQLSPTQIVGKEFDSVFRQLCSAGELKLGPSQSVLAPLSFVSAMAGVYLYLEFMKSIHSETFSQFQNYNYTYLDPMSNPNPSFRQLKRSRPDCSCQDVRVRKFFSQLWSDYGLPEGAN